MWAYVSRPFFQSFHHVLTSPPLLQLYDLCLDCECPFFAVTSHEQWSFGAFSDCKDLCYLECSRLTASFLQTTPTPGSQNLSPSTPNQHRSLRFSRIGSIPPSESGIPLSFPRLVSRLLRMFFFRSNCSLTVLFSFRFSWNGICVLST